MYRAYVTHVTNIRPAENADRLNACEVFGNTTIIDKTIAENDVIVYFPSDGQLSVEFGTKNDLFRRKDENGNDVGGYMDPEKRNVKAIRLRGNRSDGLVLPISCLDYCFKDGAINHFIVGDVIEGSVNGHEICQKYIPRSNRGSAYTAAKGNKTRQKTKPVAPLFKEHADTEQLAYNLNAFHSGDQIEISLKMHGTSQRTGYLPVLKGYKRTIWDKIFRREGEPIYEYDYICGTRRVVLDRLEQTEDGGFYGSNGFRKQHHDKFVGKLNKGETVYYEVVGFTDTGAPIMGNGKNDKLGKDFVKQYGKETVFSYGCSPTGMGEAETCWDEEKTQPALAPIVPQSDIYVYRMTMTNEDGFVVEYAPDFMRFRCDQMGVKTVPVFWKGTVDEFSNREVEDEMVYSQTAGETAMNIAERFYAGPDPVGKTHTREGVVVRIINRPKFTAYKHKNFEFKCLSGIIAEQIAESGKGEISEDMLSEL